LKTIVVSFVATYKNVKNLPPKFDSQPLKCKWL